MEGRRQRRSVSRSQSSERGDSPTPQPSKRERKSGYDVQVRRRDPALDQFFSEFRAEVKSDTNHQIDVVLDRSMESFVCKVAERLFGG